MNREQAPQNFDVCVVGAGFAGFGAALHSARRGMKTILIEKGSEWGGTAYEGMHQSLCGFYLSGEKSSPRVLNAGICGEIEETLLSRGQAEIVNTGKVFVLEYQPESMRSLFGEMTGRQENLTVLFDARVNAVDTTDRVIGGIRLNHPGEDLLIKTGAVIDCSGSGDIIRLSGASYELAPEEKRQLAAYAFVIEGVRSEGGMVNLRTAWHLAKAAEGKMIAPHVRFSVWIAGHSGNQGVLKMSVLPCDSGYDLEEIRKQAYRLHRVLKENMPEFKDSSIAETAPRVAEREGLRMKGLYTLTEDDVLSARKYEDAAVRNAWPIEFWDSREGPRYQYLEDGEYYEIPFRCLRSKDVKNLFAAGKVISVSSKALASTRVTGTCLALGEKSAEAACTYIDSSRQAENLTGGSAAAAQA